MSSSPSSRSSSESNERDRLINKSNNPNSTAAPPNKYVEEIDVVEEALEAESKDNGNTLVYAFILMLIFSLGNRIFGRLQTFPMHHYPMFMNMLSTIIYIPICFAYIFPMIMCGSKITKEQREIPKYKFAIMGLWDSVAGIMQTFAVNYISNSSTIVLVQQSAIPISMLISFITLNARYTNAQYSGAGVVLLGIVIVLIPTLLGPSPSASTSDGTTNSNSELMWILVLVLSCVPMCLSSVYKEKALGETEIDVVYLNGWVAIFQFLLSIPLMFPSATAINIPYDGIMPNLYGGMRCWMGYNTLVDDECSSAPLYVTTYLFFNIIYNILIVVILKHGSANILFMACTVIVPLSNVAFSLNIMPGHKPLKVWDIWGLVVIMLGLVLYRFTPQLLSLWKKISGQEDTEEEIEASMKAKLVGKKAESKQTKFIGFNQIEGLQSIFDTRIRKEQKESFSRTPQQLRGSLFLKLGIPPSPLISLSNNRNSRGKMTSSPSINMSPRQSRGTSPSSFAVGNIPPRRGSPKSVKNEHRGGGGGGFDFDFDSAAMPTSKTGIARKTGTGLNEV